MKKDIINISHYFNSKNLEVSKIPKEWYVHEKILRGETEANINEILNLTKKKEDKNKEEENLFSLKEEIDSSNIENLNLVLNNIKKHLNVPFLKNEKKEKTINSEILNDFLISFQNFLFEDKKLDYKDLPINEESLKIINSIKAKFSKKEENKKNILKKYNQISFSNIRKKNRMNREIEAYQKFLDGDNEEKQ